MEELKITVQTALLLAKIEKHQKRYEKSYEALMKVYKKKAEEYQRKYADFLEKTLAGKKLKQPVSPMLPADRRKTYRFYKAMIRDHTLQYIKLPTQVYRNLWLDKWDWMPQHIRALGVWADDDAGVAASFAAYKGGD
jgi:hypothetical protein